MFCTKYISQWHNVKVPIFIFQWKMYIQCCKSYFPWFCLFLFGYRKTLIFVLIFSKQSNFWQKLFKKHKHIWPLRKEKKNDSSLDWIRYLNQTTKPWLLIIHNQFQIKKIRHHQVLLHSPLRLDVLMSFIKRQSPSQLHM